MPGRFGIEFLPANDLLGEQPGPNRPEWKQVLGEYTGRTHEHISKTTVSVRNGYLYISWQGGLKLIEYKPGLFFTADGEAVSFQGDRMMPGNRPFSKERKFSSQLPAVPDHHRHRRG